jgi:CspA family cold shock protein
MTRLDHAVLFGRVRSAQAQFTKPPGQFGGFLLDRLSLHRSNIAIFYFREESDVASGTVKWFNGQKGYGFIAPDGGGKDVFVHISAVEKAGMDGLPDGAKITYDIISDRGKESAGNLLLK